MPLHSTSELPYPFDPSDNAQVSRGHAFHLMLDHAYCLCTHQVDSFLAELSKDELFGRNLRCQVNSGTQDATTAGHFPLTGSLVPESDEPLIEFTHSMQMEPRWYTRNYLLEISKYLGYRPPEVVMHTLHNTTQLGTTAYVTFPMRRHFKPRNPQLNVP